MEPDQTFPGPRRNRPRDPRKEPVPRGEVQDEFRWAYRKLGLLWVAWSATTVVAVTALLVAILR